MTLDQLVDRGFDASARRGWYVRVQCSQCEAVVLNGTAVHETGCPNDTRVCRGCNERIPARARYCAECAQ